MLDEAEAAFAKGEPIVAIDLAATAMLYAEEARETARRCAKFAQETRRAARQTGDDLDGYAAVDAEAWADNARRCAAEARCILPPCRAIIREAEASIAAGQIQKKPDANATPQKRAKGQRGPKATAKDYIPQLRARTVVEIKTGKGFMCLSDEQANKEIRSGKFRRATAEEVADSAKWMAIEKRPVRVPSACKAVLA